MRCVVQRVSQASVKVEGETISAIGRGFLVLAGATHADGPRDVAAAARKIANLRVFEDTDGRMNLSLLECGGSVLVVSQFTLYADVRKGRRPSFTDAARPEVAEPLVTALCAGLREQGLEVAEGRFGAHMEIALVNDGPVTILLDSDELTTGKG